MTDNDSIFSAQRRRLFGIAYRMLGNVSDADDVVQDAWLRWREQKVPEIDNPQAYLTRIATSLSIDALRRRRRSTEQYPGPWLPAPLGVDGTTEDAVADGESSLMLAETLSVALLVLLEELRPNERAAFVLREAFELSFDEIGACLGAPAATCRQWRKRARDRLQGVAWEQQRAQLERGMLERFLGALASGDANALLALLDDEVVLVSDGGGKVAAATRPLHGTRAVSRFLLGLAARRRPDTQVELAPLNGGCGVLLRNAGVVETALVVDVRDNRIRGLYLQRNPDKLAALNANRRSTTVDRT